MMVREWQVVNRIRAASPRPTSAALPPADRWFVANQPGCDLDVAQVAELPELLRCPRVLEDQFVDFESVEFAGPELFDGVTNVMDEFAQLILVVRGDGLSSCPTI